MKERCDKEPFEVSPSPYIINKTMPNASLKYADSVRNLMINPGEETFGRKNALKNLRASGCYWLSRLHVARCVKTNVLVAHKARIGLFYWTNNWINK